MGNENKLLSAEELKREKRKKQLAAIKASNEMLEQAKKTGKQTAVLFRNNDSAVVLVDLLERSNTAYRIRSGERTFFTYRLVSDICNIVRFSKDPSDTESFMQIYYKLGLFITLMIKSPFLDNQQSRRSKFIHIIWCEDS